jgi:hypothetical protein
VKYKLTREIFAGAGVEDFRGTFTDIVETNNPDAAIRPFCLGKDARCDIAEYADGLRVYEIRTGGVRQVIKLDRWRGTDS